VKEKEKWADEMTLTRGQDGGWRVWGRKRSLGIDRTAYFTTAAEALEWMRVSLVDDEIR
jgi:hypothetical protein